MAAAESEAQADSSMQAHGSHDAAPGLGEAIRVHIEGQGDVNGRVREGVARFLGIPYAAAERWKPPQAPPPWRELPKKRLARCPQPGQAGKTYEGYALEDDEDCLQLNIWTPLSALQDSTPKSPVLVYIHGGGGKSHSAHCPRESGHQLALKQGTMKGSRIHISRHTPHVVHPRR